MTGSGLKKLWEEVREASGLPWFRMYDTRHSGATRLAEAGVPTEIIVARMGHCSDQMRRHYTHISSEAQRMWLRKSPTPQPKVQSTQRYNGGLGIQGGFAYSQPPTRYTAPPAAPVDPAALIGQLLQANVD